MARSTLGKWLQVGNEQFDPLDLATYGSDVEALLREYIEVEGLLAVTSELFNVLEELRENPSGTHRGTSDSRLKDYYVSYSRDAQLFRVSIAPSPAHKKINLNVFELLDKGNKPKGADLITPQNAKRFVFNSYVGNLVSTSGPVTASPVSVGDKTGVRAVRPYKGRQLYKRILTQNLTTSYFDRVAQDMARTISRGKARTYEQDLRKRFRQVFPTENLYSVVSPQRRKRAYVWLDNMTFDQLFSSLRSAKLRFREVN